MTREGHMIDAGVLSFTMLRRWVGVLGFALPLILMLGWAVHVQYGSWPDTESGSLVPDSISGYYHTPLRNWLVGVLWAIGFFLIFYRFIDETDKRYWLDNVISTIAGASAIGVAMFPTTKDWVAKRADGVVDAGQPIGEITTAIFGIETVGVLHYVFALSFFIALIIMAGFLFTQSAGKGKRTTRKRRRNRVYIVSACIMAVALVAIPVMLRFEANTRPWLLKPVFIGEWFAVWAFASAWFVKSEPPFFRDRKSEPSQSKSA